MDWFLYDRDLHHEKVNDSDHSEKIINWLNANVAIVQKPVNWFALQINWLVSI